MPASRNSFAVIAISGLDLTHRACPVVEMVVTRPSKIEIDEVAPHPLNAGYFTIEAYLTCQFAPQIRAVMGPTLDDKTRCALSP